MSERVQLIIGCGLIGAAVGASLDSVPATWWLAWAVAWSSLYAINHFHRRDRCPSA